MLNCIISFNILYTLNCVALATLCRSDTKKGTRCSKDSKNLLKFLNSPLKQCNCINCCDENDQVEDVLTGQSVWQKNMIASRSTEMSLFPRQPSWQPS